MDDSAARWALARKDLIGCAIGETSRVWFSCADGILTEVFYPGPDQACTRRFELVVADDDGVAEEAADTDHAISVADRQVPAARFENTGRRGRFRIEKEVIADPLADVVLVRARLVAPDAARLYCILEPHLGNRGDDNTAELGFHKGIAMLFAERADGLAVAVAASAPFLEATAGFVGDDGRTQLRRRGRIATRLERAERGDVSIAAQVDLRATGGDVTFALGFARTRSEAAHLALGALHRGFAAAHARYASEWKAWHAQLATPPTTAVRALWTTSLTVLKTLEAKHPTGGRVAALGTPWGRARGPGLEGTYHLVWTRDLVQCATAMLATGAHDEVRHALEYLRCTQEADGHWPQNMRLCGDAVWDHTELDEVALPVVFVARVRRAGLIGDAELRAAWPMVDRAARWIATHGPETKRDRWEDTSGVVVSSLSVAIVALLAAAELAQLLGHDPLAARHRALADAWHASIDRFLYRRGGALADAVGVPGYYVRCHGLDAPWPALDLADLPATELSPDALALVRFGLRAADDPRIVDTVRVIDAILRDELPGGPAWRRYPGDRYGEHADGAPFDEHGSGRAWPLLTGERAHYELACGRADAAAGLAAAMESFANASEYLSEQVWNAPAIPARALVPGKPTRSVAPLGWAHAEYLSLCRSLAAGHVIDRPAISFDRYLAR